MCENQNCIPVGMSTDCKISRIKIYCPRCKDVYNPKKKSADVDGAFFGPSFPYLLLMVHFSLIKLFRLIQI
jgi:casein kinase II subunit beta